MKKLRRLVTQRRKLRVFVRKGIRKNIISYYFSAFTINSTTTCVRRPSRFGGSQISVHRLKTIYYLTIVLKIKEVTNFASENLKGIRKNIVSYYSSAFTINSTTDHGAEFHDAIASCYFNCMLIN